MHAVAKFLVRLLAGCCRLHCIAIGRRYQLFHYHYIFVLFVGFVDVGEKRVKTRRRRCRRTMSAADAKRKNCFRVGDAMKCAKCMLTNDIKLFTRRAHTDNRRLSLSSIHRRHPMKKPNKTFIVCSSSVLCRLFCVSRQNGKVFLYVLFCTCASTKILPTKHQKYSQKIYAETKTVVTSSQAFLPPSRIQEKQLRQTYSESFF